MVSDPIWSMVSSSSAARAAQSTSSASSKQDPLADATGLGKDAFMKLLLTQMQNQDPLNPMDGQAFFAQLAQLSLLEQMYTLNDTLASSQRQQQLVQAGTMIGRTVEATKTDGTTLTGVVNGASMLDGDVFLDVDGTQVALSSVTSVQA
jgi:flagellar basal-body rod modification protein FlgD